MSANPPYDIVLDLDGNSPLGLMLGRPTGKRPQTPFGAAVTQGQYGPSEGTDEAGAERTVSYDGFDDGAGFGRRRPNGIRGYGWGTFLTTRGGGVAMPSGELVQVNAGGWATLGTGVCALVWNDVLYWSTEGAAIYRMPLDGTDSPTVALTVANGLGEADNMALFNGNLYVGMHGANVGGLGGPAALVKFNGSAWSTHNVKRRKLAVNYWVVKGVGANRLIGTDETNYNERHVAGDPTVDANWTSAVQIGDATDTVKSLAVGNRVVYWVKASGVHSMDSRGYSPNLTPHWRDNFNAESGGAAMLYEGQVMASHFEGIDAVQVEGGTLEDVPTWVDPAHVLPDSGPVHGTPVAFCNERGWLVAAFYNRQANRSYLAHAISRARVGSNGPGPFAWHFSEADVPGRITCLKVAPVGTAPYLWIWAKSSNVPTLYRQSLPQAASAYQDWLEGGPMRFSTSTTLDFGREAWGRTGTLKTVRRLALTSENLSSGLPTITVAASADGGAFADQLTATESPQMGGHPSEEIATGYEIEPRCTFAGTATEPAILRALDVTAELNPDQTEVREYTVKVGALVKRDNGTLITDDADRTIAQLEGFQHAGDPIAMLDEYGRTLLVNVRGGMHKEIREDPDESPGKTRTTYVTFRVSVLLRAGYYDNAAFPDSGFMWS